MPRRKNNPDTETIDAIPELDDDEQIVVENSNRRTIRKERVPQPNAETINDVEDEDQDEIADRQRFSETSLAALEFSDDLEFENQFCNVTVRRNPDAMNDRFVNPNHSVLTLPPMRNIELTAERSDIEEQVRALHGGGHYFFQIQINGRLGKSWKVTLADTPEQVAASKTPQPAVIQPPVPVENPLDSFFDTLRKQKEMKDLLFGDDLRRLEELEEENQRLREAAAQPPPQAAQLPENLLILEKALGVTNPTIQDRLIDAAFPDDSGEHWVPATLKTVFEHKEEIAGLLGSLLGGFLPQPKPQPNSIEALLEQQPPAALNPQPLPTSKFRRRTAQPTEAENVEPENASEPEAIDLQFEPATPEFLSQFTITPADVSEPETETEEKIEDGE